LRLTYKILHSGIMNIFSYIFSYWI
jgi:hypothetical protein